ncbi:MAG: hypothetical protein HQ522_04195 [Bacteroidetes bacterium]|nr:hypothetical protein [Bacteroidota bacterium]
MSCVCIDDWSEFEGPKDEFLVNFNKYKGENDATFIEKNCWDVDVNELGRFNIFMYDGNHKFSSHFKALNTYLPCLDDEFIFFVDDWNWLFVSRGTQNSIEKNNVEVVWKKEILTTPDNKHPLEYGKLSEWHNGLCIFVLKKT